MHLTVSLTLLIAFRSLLVMFAGTVLVYVVQQTIKNDLYSVVSKRRASNKKSKVIQNKTFTIGKPVVCLIEILLKSEEQTLLSKVSSLAFIILSYEGR